MVEAMIKAPTELVYLSCPYSHSEPETQRKRFELANAHAAGLLRRGVMVFSPISHSYPIAAYGLPGDFAFWQEWNRQCLLACKAIVVLALPGWSESVGVGKEIAYMQALGRPVYFLTPSYIEWECREWDVLANLLKEKV